MPIRKRHQDGLVNHFNFTRDNLEVKGQKIFSPHGNLGFYSRPKDEVTETATDTYEVSARLGADRINRFSVTGQVKTDSSGKGFHQDLMIKDLDGTPDLTHRYDEKSNSIFIYNGDTCSLNFPLAEGSSFTSQASTEPVGSLSFKLTEDGAYLSNI